MARTATLPNGKPARALFRWVARKYERQLQAAHPEASDHRFVTVKQKKGRSRFRVEDRGVDA